MAWVYLTVVVDLYDREVIGWPLRCGMETTATTNTTLEAESVILLKPVRKAREIKGVSTTGQSTRRLAATYQ